MMVELCGMNLQAIYYAPTLALSTAIKLVMGHCRFYFFRIFDIWKPFPISWADQKVTGGLGIMLDDIIAGLWAALCIFMIHFYFLT
jgi:phosphatidylglycerophosphatase A